MQRPVFFARGIIIAAYLPIFTLQAVEGRLFKPMAWTVSFALIGALVFSMLVAPVMASFFFSKGATEWQNPLMVWLTARTARRRWAIEHRYRTVGIAALLFACRRLPRLRRRHRLGVSAPPRRRLHLGARHPGAQHRPHRSLRFHQQARLVLASFPEVTQVVSQTGRPDDGTDTTGFFNTEYFVDLKPKEQWRPVFHQDKEELIAAMDYELRRFPASSGTSPSPSPTTWKRPSAA